MITIIEKIELGENNELKSEPVGFTENINLINEINEHYDSGLGEFIGANRTKLENGLISISIFFDFTSHVHEARSSTDAIEELNLTEIININEL